ncbi:MAG: alpha/beta hydrolase, partial [Lachnospiraceae bacterium]|nr:alpha/beta hydrolase [Lachnospiraceae bacterium]
MLWEGYEMETGMYQGFEYGIVFPEKFQKGELPYIWRTEFFGAFPAVDLAMLKKGYPVVYYRISDLYGSPEAVSKMAEFQPFIQEKYKLAPKAILFGFSRGGLYALHYAAKYPERVTSLYLDAPVVDIYSWPGGFGLSQRAANEWEECRALWNQTREEYQNLVNLAMERIAQRIPLILVAGGKDEIVPYSENGALLQAVYQKGDTPFKVIIKPDCGHHPHSLDDPAPVVKFLMESSSFSEGNAFRINDQSLSRYPLVLMVHDREHIGVVGCAENTFLGKIPFGYIGTSPWMGTMTNNRTLRYSDPLNLQLYDFLQTQMETGWTLFAQKVEGDGEEILTFLKDQKKNYPSTKQVWLKQREELLPSSFLCGLREVGIELKEYGNQEELKLWLNVLKEEVLRAEPPIWFDSFDREWAEWSNFSITLPRNEKENRILLVGDSISAGYGDMVQKKLSEFHVDRLNTSEGIHHPNFLRLLEIA